MVKWAKILAFLLAGTLVVGAGVFAYVDWGKDIYIRTIGSTLGMCLIAFCLVALFADLGKGGESDLLYRTQRDGIWWQIIAFSSVIALITAYFCFLYFIVK